MPQIVSHTQTNLNAPLTDTRIPQKLLYNHSTHPIRAPNAQGFPICAQTHAQCDKPQSPANEA